MLKEYIICIIIIISIFIGNNITQNYTINSIENMNNDLRELKDIVDRNSENDFNILNEKKEEIDKRWNEMFSKLAYYIEHDELEKFAKNLENILEAN